MGQPEGFQPRAVPGDCAGEQSPKGSPAERAERLASEEEHSTLSPFLGGQADMHWTEPRAVLHLSYAVEHSRELRRFQ